MRAIAHANWNNKASVLGEIRSKYSNGPTSPIPGARGDRQRVFADGDFSFKGENIQRRFNAPDFDVIVKYKEKDGLSRDVFDVFYECTAASGDVVTWGVGTIVNSAP